MITSGHEENHPGLTAGLSGWTLPPGFPPDERRCIRGIRPLCPAEGCLLPTRGRSTGRERLPDTKPGLPASAPEPAGGLLSRPSHRREASARPLAVAARRGHQGWPEQWDRVLRCVRQPVLPATVSNGRAHAPGRLRVSPRRLLPALGRRAAPGLGADGF